jgi:hypothetical protein
MNRTIRALPALTRPRSPRSCSSFGELAHLHLARNRARPEGTPEPCLHQRSQLSDAVLPNSPDSPARPSTAGRRRPRLPRRHR